MENNFGQVELVKDIELDEGNSDSENIAVAEEVPFISESIIIYDESFFAVGSVNTSEETYKLVVPDDSIELEINPDVAIKEDTQIVATSPMLTATSSIAFIRGTDAAESIEGTATNEVIQGEGGDDIIAGRGGDDTLSGGAGEDILIGGVGSDRFVIELDSGIDKFIDFTQGEDQIALPSSLTFEQLSFDGNDIQFGDETLATVAFLDANNLIAADFTIAQ